MKNNEMDLRARRKELRDRQYKEIISSVMSSLKKYDVKDLRWALNRWAKKENAKARLRKEIADRKKELSSIK